MTVLQSSPKQLLEKAGIKPSVQRMAILGYLMEHRTHPTVDEIYSSLYTDIPTLSKTTVYNTLRLLVDGGVAQMLTISEHNLCFDADTSPHAHFLCKSCGKVYDLDYIPFKDPVPGMVEGHKVTEVYQYLRGVCKCCQSV